MSASVCVTSAAQAAARDAAAIAAGTDSFALMCAAGTVAAAEIVRVAGNRFAHGVRVHCGPGNNGGDGYVVAAQLARLGARVTVHAALPPRSPDAQRAERLARRHLPAGAFTTSVPADAQGGVVIDALLGTGATGPLRGAIADGAAAVQAARAHGACVVALDVPSGVDATTGARADGHVVAQHTVTFGTLKAGLLAARDVCGRITVADIGLGASTALDDDAARLATPDALAACVPPIAWDAHKGTRGRVLVVGGATGMAGAVQFVARGALASGAGLVRALVSSESARALQAAVPAVVCVHADGAPHDALPDETFAWPHAIVLGPGLGRDPSAMGRTFEALRTVLALAGGDASRTPALVLDADALVVCANDDGLAALAACARVTPVVLTPHAGEAVRLAAACGLPFDAGAREPLVRLAAARAIAARTRCHVLLKGAPTLCVAPDGEAWVVPRGGPSLATGGTGDVLAGVLGALLATAAATGAGVAPVRLAALGAWVHGVAGEQPVRAAGARGATVEQVIAALGDAWVAVAAPAARPPGVLATLPAVPA
jgi:NAD(P)H-hydrate epimerase